MALTFHPQTAIDAEAVMPLATAKQLLRVEGSDEDAILGHLWRTALGQIERETQRSLQQRAWRVTFDRFASSMRMPIGPVTTVSAVTYLSASGVATDLVNSLWRLAGDVVQPAVGTAWPVGISAPGAVTMTVEAGYADAATEAPELVTAALMLLGHWNANREAVVTGTTATELPLAVDALIGTYRTPVIG